MEDAFENLHLFKIVTLGALCWYSKFFSCILVTAKQEAGQELWKQTNIYTHLCIYICVCICVHVYFNLFCSEVPLRKGIREDEEGKHHWSCNAFPRQPADERPSCPAALWPTQGLPGMFLWSLIKWGLLSRSSQPGSVPAVPPWLAAKLGVLYFPLGLPSPTPPLIPVAMLPLRPLEVRALRRRASEQSWQVGRVCTAAPFSSFMNSVDISPGSLVLCPYTASSPSHFRLRLTECLEIVGGNARVRPGREGVGPVC